MGSVALGTALALLVPAVLAQYEWDNWPYIPARLRDRSWHVGSATFYGTDMVSGSNSGNCGYPWVFVNSVNQAAVPDPRYADSKTPGVSNFVGAACGQCFELMCYRKPRYANKDFCKDGRIRVVVTNYDVPVPLSQTKFPAPYGWPHNHFDLFRDGFSKIADPSAGMVNVLWRRVPCRKSHSKYTVSGNPWWHDVVIYNVPGAGAVVQVYVRAGGSSKWTPLQHGWGAHWWLSGYTDFNDPRTVVMGRVAESSRKFVFPKRTYYSAP